MRKMILIAGAAVAAISLPAMAQDHGRGGGAGNGGAGPAIERTAPMPQVDRTIPNSNANDRASGQVRDDVRAQTDVHASHRAHERTGASVDHSATVNGNTAAATGASAGVNTRASTKTPNYGGNTCPPGLAGRTPACVPPGQAGRTFTVGQRLSDNFRFYTEFGSIPDSARAQVPAQYQTDAYRFIYQPDRIYVVDRNTNTVTTVVNLNP